MKLTAEGCKYRGFSHDPTRGPIGVCMFYDNFWPLCENDDSVPEYCPALEPLTNRQKVAVDTLVNMGMSETRARQIVGGILRGAK